MNFKRFIEGWLYRRDSTVTVPLFQALEDKYLLAKFTYHIVSKLNEVFPNDFFNEYLFLANQFIVNINDKSLDSVRNSLTSLANDLSSNIASNRILVRDFPGNDVFRIKYTAYLATQSFCLNLVINYHNSTNIHLNESIQRIASAIATATGGDFQSIYRKFIKYGNDLVYNYYNQTDYRAGPDKITDYRAELEELATMSPVEITPDEIKFIITYLNDEGLIENLIEYFREEEIIQRYVKIYGPTKEIEAIFAYVNKSPLAKFDLLRFLRDALRY